MTNDTESPQTIADEPVDEAQSVEDPNYAPPKPNAKGEKPVSHSLCGWCGSGNHQKCQDKGGFIKFDHGVHSGLQCKCFDAIDPATGENHAYRITRSAPAKGEKEPRARRKSGR